MENHGAGIRFSCRTEWLPGRDMLENVFSVVLR